MFLPISHMPPSGIMRRVARLGCSLARERIVGGFLPTHCRVCEMQGFSSSAIGATMRRRMPVCGRSAGRALFARGRGGLRRGCIGLAACCGAAICGALPVLPTAAVARGLAVRVFAFGARGA